MQCPDGDVGGASNGGGNYFLSVSIKIQTDEGEKGNEYIPVVAGLEADNAIDRWDGWERSVAQAECTVKVRIVWDHYLVSLSCSRRRLLGCRDMRLPGTRDCSRNCLSDHGGVSSDGRPAGYRAERAVPPAPLGASEPA